MNDPDDKTGRRPHTLQDHLQGAEHDHAHDPDEAHDHDHDDFEPGALEDNPIWRQDHITLTSVGIDIGSAGTQVIFSRLNMRRPGEDLSSRYFVVSRETLYQSPVALTPYLDEERIDAQAIGTIVDHAYAAAALHPDNIDTGVVILTGEALRRHNAQAIAEVLATEGGEFVCATAGHHMEAMLAAYGSGAARASHDRGARLLNIDIGGGTTKLAVIEDGQVRATAAVHIGGRLLVVDAENRIVRLDPAGRDLARRAGYTWRVGDTVDAAALARVADWMSDALIAIVSQSSSAVQDLYLTPPLEMDRIDGMMFSGGVAEFIYGREQRDFGDLGRLLGAALRAKIEKGALPWPLLPAGECIRATALGASEYSVQLSGNTLYISDPGTLLPRKNLQVLQPSYRLAGEINPDELGRAIQNHFTSFDLTEGEHEVALAFRWKGAPAYERVAAFARGITQGLRNTIAHGKPLFLILDGDVAHTVGRLLREELEVRSEMLVVDGITLWDFDYIDLGRIRMPSQTVPVTIKSLVFSQDPRAPHGHPHGHHHRRDALNHIPRYRGEK